MNRAGELRPRRWLLAAALVIAAAALFLPAGASARPRPTVSLSFTNASEGAPISFTWSARHVGGTRLAIQRPVGTAKVWKNVMRLSGPGGSGQLPDQPLGTYRYRVAALRGRSVVAQQVATAHVFGQVPFSTLFRGVYLTTGHVESSSYATPTTSFPYIGYGYIGDQGHPNTIFSISRNHCSAVHVGFVLGQPPGEGYERPSDIYGTVTLVQQSRDPLASEVPLNGTSSIDAELTPGQTWALLAVASNREGELGNPNVYFNGYAVCDSAEPFGS